MSIKNLFPAFLVLLLVAPAYSQKDSTYIQSFHNKLTVSPNLFAVDYRISLQSTTGKSAYFRNTRLNTGIWIAYKELGLNITMPVLSLYHPTAGKPQRVGLALNYQKPDFLTRVYLQKIQGFYQEYPNAEIYRDDMRIWYGFLNGFYLFNHQKYSLKSSFNFSERQKKSQGSWLISGLLSAQLLYADSLAISLPEQPDSLALTGYRSLQAGLGGGYAYTWIHKRWFFTLQAGVAVGTFTYIRLVGTDQHLDRNQWRFSPELNTQAGCGYNGRRFFAALNGFYLPETDYTGTIKVGVEDRQISLLMGWRLL